MGFHNQNRTFLVLGAKYGTGNMGVDALLSGTITSIRNADPSAEIIIVDFSVRAENYLTPDSEKVIRLENIRFSWKLWLRNNGFRLMMIGCLLRLLPFNLLRRWMLKNHPALKTICKGTTALSLAGGDSFSDIYGFQRFLYVCLPQLLVLTLQRPLVLLPQTLGPFQTRWSRAVSRFIMNKAERVYSRDEEGLSLMRQFPGIAASRLEYSHDMAFALEPSCPSGGSPDWITQKNDSLVGLNVSGLLYMGGYTYDNMFGLQVDYPSLMRELIHWFMSESASDVVLFSHVTGSGRENDFQACAELHSQMAAECNDRLHLANLEYDHREVKYLIGQCDFFLGARMHACIAALSQMVPAIGMAYSRKFQGVFESVGVAELVVDLREMNETTILKRVQKAFRKQDEIREKLKTSAVFARNRALEIVGRITESESTSATSAVKGYNLPVNYQDSLKSD